MAYQNGTDAVLHGVCVGRQRRVILKTANVFAVLLVDC